MDRCTAVTHAALQTAAAHTTPHHLTPHHTGTDCTSYSEPPAAVSAVRARCHVQPSAFAAADDSCAMSVSPHSSSHTTSRQPRPPTNPPSRRYLPPYIYRSSPSSPGSVSPLSISPSSSSPSQSLSPHSSTHSPLSLARPELSPAVAVADTMTKGKHSGPQSGLQTPNKSAQQQREQRDTHFATTPSVGSGSPPLPASPAVLSPASVKSLIPARSEHTAGTPAKRTTSMQQLDSPAVIHSGQAVKQAIEQLSSSGSSGGSVSEAGQASKRPSIAAHISTGTVAQRVSDYNSAVAAGDSVSPSSAPSDMPQPAPDVAELISQFSPGEQPGPDIQHTQHKWTATQAQQTQSESATQMHGEKKMKGDETSHDFPPHNPTAEVGQRDHSDGLTSTLTAHSSLSSEPGFQSATPLATADMQPNRSTLVEPATALPAASNTPPSTKQTRKQRKAQAAAAAAAARAEQLSAPAVVDPAPDAHGLLTRQALLAAQSASDTVFSVGRSERFVWRVLRRLRPACMWSVWAALLMCSVDLCFRLPNWESATLCGLTATAVIVNSARIARPGQSATPSSSVSHAALNGFTAIAAAALPFLFAQRLAARSTLYVSQHVHTASHSLPAITILAPSLICHCRLCYPFCRVSGCSVSIPAYCCWLCLCLCAASHWLLCAAGIVSIVGVSACCRLSLCISTVLPVCCASASPSLCFIRASPLSLRPTPLPGRLCLLSPRRMLG